MKIVEAFKAKYNRVPTLPEYAAYFQKYHKRKPTHKEAAAALGGNLTTAPQALAPVVKESPKEKPGTKININPVYVVLYSIAGVCIVVSATLTASALSQAFHNPLIGWMLSIAFVGYAAVGLLLSAKLKATKQIASAVVAFVLWVIVTLYSMYSAVVAQVPNISGERLSIESIRKQAADVTADNNRIEDSITEYNTSINLNKQRLTEYETDRRKYAALFEKNRSDWYSYNERDRIDNAIKDIKEENKQLTVKKEQAERSLKKAEINQEKETPFYFLADFLPGDELFYERIYILIPTIIIDIIGSISLFMIEKLKRKADSDESA